MENFGFEVGETDVTDEGGGRWHGGSLLAAHVEQYAFGGRIQEGARPSRSVFARNGMSGSGGEASSEGQTSVDRLGLGSERMFPWLGARPGLKPSHLVHRSPGGARSAMQSSCARSPPRRTWLVGAGKTASAGLEYAIPASSGLGRFGVGLRESSHRLRPHRTRAKNARFSAPCQPWNDSAMALPRGFEPLSTP